MITFTSSHFRRSSNECRLTLDLLEADTISFICKVSITKCRRNNYVHKHRAINGTQIVVHVIV